MLILGISGGVRHGNQDGAAALLRDGRTIAALEEERPLRVKHAVGLLPEKAISTCLEAGKVSIAEVDAVATHGDTFVGFEEVLQRWFRFRFGVCPPIRRFNHHLAHGASAYYASGLAEAMIFTADLSGDGVSTMLAHGKNGAIDVVEQYKKPDSLGIYYSLITQFLGFRRDNDEYKVMGLSSYGRDTVDLSWLLEYADGAYHFHDEYMRPVKPGESNPSKQEPMFSNRFLERMRAQPRLEHEPITEFHENLACSAQRRLEDCAVHLITHLHEKTGSRNLCVAGGVGLNCVMNQKLLALPFIDQVYVQPASSDAGVSLGAAYLAARAEGDAVAPLCDAYLGREYSADEIREALDMLNVPYHQMDDFYDFASRKLAAGHIVGLFQGRDEFGPRALGNRSILANPQSASMQDRVNERIKFRESFRPFAPAILEEHSARYLRGYKHAAPYMTITFDVADEKKADIAATVHVDGTARAQTVSDKQAPVFAGIIRRCQEITGVPALLNTSFNVRGQAIVHTPTQAVSTLYGSGMDHLVIPPFVLSKHNED